MFFLVQNESHFAKIDQFERILKVGFEVVEVGKGILNTWNFKASLTCLISLIMMSLYVTFVPFDHSHEHNG